MTETDSSFALCRTLSEMFVLSIISCGWVLAFMSRASGAMVSTTWGCGVGLAAVGCACDSADISSSISVVSVPLEVAGDGPGISLGDMRKFAELGRATIVEGGIEAGRNLSFAPGLLYE